MQLSGLHHVTAITGQAARNVEFYTQVLGLRLVKKTVNQDDVSAYHLFYADAKGSPGTDVTFFDWPQTIKNVNGAGSISRVALRAPSRTALDWWARRLNEAGAAVEGVIEDDSRARIHFSDPEGLELALVDDGGAPGGTPWERSPVPPEMAVRGLHAVKLQVRDPRPMAAVLTQVLGFKAVGEYAAGGDRGRTVTVYALGSGGPGTEVEVEAGAHLPANRLGRGGVHHVAFRTPDDEEQQAWRQRIGEVGLRVTPVIDRFYFKSIYFQVPEGILFEIATDGPGFAADEDLEHLGERLALPPFLEPHRESIEAGLHPIEFDGMQPQDRP
jgi:glyoxalase family protein